MEANSEAVRTGGIGSADRVDLLVEELCREARATYSAGADESFPFRADTIYQAVMRDVREREERRQRLWSARLMRFANRLAAPVSALWNSRIARSLVP